MAISQAICSSFKEELLEGIHDLAGDTIKVALFTSAATLGAATTAYVASDEVSGPGYTAGGEDLTGNAVTLDGTTAIVDFDNVEWTAATITGIRGALLYNSSKANRAIAVLDFGGDYNVSSGTFRIVFPAPAAATAILRLS